LHCAADHPAGVQSEVVVARAEFTVFLVGHDARLAAALTNLLSRAGYMTRTYSSSGSFLSSHDSSVPGCAVLDLSMQDLRGLDVQQILRREEIERPVLFLTDHATVPVTVRAMRAGAIDVLLKPVNPSELLRSIRHASGRDETNRRAQTERRTIGALAQKLSPREKEVLTHVVAGLRNKDIAEILGIGVKTIKVHRGRVMKKLEVTSVAELVRMATKISWEPDHPDHIVPPPTPRSLNGNAPEYLLQAKG
jgi:RNA polymerase sigma factor (sigma-70 family)